jgi:hypothetical protein
MTATCGLLVRWRSRRFAATGSVHRIGASPDHAPRLSGVLPITLSTADVIAGPDSA